MIVEEETQAWAIKKELKKKEIDSRIGKGRDDLIVRETAFPDPKFFVDRRYGKY